MLESQVSFCHQSSPVSRKARTFALNIAGVKKYTQITCACGQHWKSFVSPSECRGELGTVEICVLCGWWFSNQLDIVSETPYSWSTVGCELWWAILCSLPCPETDWNIRVRKKGYVFILTDLRSEVFLFSFLTSICVNNYFGNWEKLNILYKLMPQTFFLVLGLLNSS